MERKLFALLVGINDYPAPSVANLKGCIEDVENLEYFLQGEFEDLNPEIIMLQDGEATRENVIKHFREHLSKAGPNDIAFFHYSGHGSREPAAPEFKELYPDGWDETLVCHDSRSGGHDLADKEMAVLVAEVAANEPHVVISLDSCHSGSGTRSVGEQELILRQTSDKSTPRDINSYIDGYYAKNGPSVPTSKHLLMASCTRYETAADGGSGGLYSSGLMEALENFGKEISYADLYLKCRNQVNKLAKKKNHNQHPQFEAYGYFNAFGKFLDGSPVSNRDRYPVQFDLDSGEWAIGFGMINGMPAETEKPVEVAIYKERADSSDKVLKNTTVTWVGATKSGIDFSHDEQSDTLYAELTSFPIPPLPVVVSGDEAKLAQIKQVKAEKHANLAVDFVGSSDEAACKLEVSDSEIKLMKTDGKTLIIGTRMSDKAKSENEKEAFDNNADFILKQLDSVIKFERSNRLENNRPKLNPDDVEFRVFPATGDEPYEGNSIDLKFSGEEIKVKIKAKNDTPQDVFITLIYYGEDYSIHPLVSTSLEKGTGFMTIWGAEEEDYLYLEDEIDSSSEQFKLLVTTEQPDSFLLSQDGLENYGLMLTDPSFRGIGKFKKKEKVKNDWFTKRITLNVSR